MEPSAASSFSQRHTYAAIPADRQAFHRSQSAVGVSTGPLLHLTRIGTALAPLIVLEAVKEPARQMRWIRIVSLLGAAAGEGVWALREHQRREDRERKYLERA